MDDSGTQGEREMHDMYSGMWPYFLEQSNVNMVWRVSFVERFILLCSYLHYFYRCINLFKLFFITFLIQGPYFAPAYEPLPSSVKFYYNGLWTFVLAVTRPLINWNQVSQWNWARRLKKRQLFSVKCWTTITQRNTSSVRTSLLIGERWALFRISINILKATIRWTKKHNV